MFWPKISRFTLRPIFIIHERLIHTVNDRLSALGAYAFGWTLVRTGYLIGSGRLVKNKKIKITKRVRQVHFSQKSQYSSQH